MEIDEVCRICLTHNLLMENLFELKFKSNLTVTDKIIEFTNIELLKNPNLPQHICSQCIDDLESACRFHYNCQNSDSLLRTYLARKETDPEATIHNTLLIKEELKEENDSDTGDQYVENEENASGSEHIQALNNNKKKRLEDNKIILRRPRSKRLKSKPSQRYNNMFFNRRSYNKNKMQARPEQKTKTTTKVVKKKKDRSLKPQICEICGAQYKTYSAYWCHKRRHLGVRKFKCEICAMTFVDKSILKGHMRTHTGEKLFHCTVCEKSFGTNHSLMRHKRIHTGERPFPCSYADCGKSFTLSHGLSRHILTHTGQKPYACKTCGLRFTQSQHLRTHNNIHLREEGKPFKKYVRPEKKKTVGEGKSISEITVPKTENISAAT